MIKILIFLLLLFSLLPVNVDAAEFRVESDTASFSVGDEFLVTVLVDTQEESINAFAGHVVFPEELLELKGIQEKGSIVNLWVEEPPVFSGLTPGGYTGKGVLFSLIFKAKAEGVGTISIAESRALLNDGAGTNADLTILNFKFLISNQVPNTKSQTVDIDDAEAPEPFELNVAQDSNAFEGQHFLVFATQDKNSGVDHYEISFIRNGKTTSWEKAESPLLLAQYNQIEQIQVKAVDRAGNERIATLLLKDSPRPFLFYVSFGIMLGIGMVILFYFVWKRKTQRQPRRKHHVRT